jgi:transposase InsO family protein
VGQPRSTQRRPRQTVNLSAAPAGHVESFNGRVRDEFLNTELFFSLKEAQVLAEAWRVRQAQPTREYNDYRPHSSLGGQTPTDFAQEWAVNQKLS